MIGNMLQVFPPLTLLTKKPGKALDRSNATGGMYLPSYRHLNSITLNPSTVNRQLLLKGDSFHFEALSTLGGIDHLHCFPLVAVNTGRINC